ncbi:MAG: hypothetical protein J6U43_01520 [Bacteroidales bacterium]|nr:hypothetical protein [Bacteroidales bacterium]
MKKVVFVLALLLIGCTKYVPITTIEKEIQYIDKYVQDSIYTSDTTLIYQKGDTIYNDRIKYVAIYKKTTDTISYARIDSIPYPVEVFKYKEVTPKWAWYTLVISVFGVVSLSILMWKKIRILWR